MPMVLMYHSVDSVTDDRTADGQSAALRAADALAEPAGPARGGDSRVARSAGAGRRQGLVGLTFDDGYADFPEQVLPVLQLHGFTATAYVIAGRLGGHNTWDAEARASS